jgi:hypothetical protein
MSENRLALEQALKAMHTYFNENSLIGGILESNEEESQTVDGFFLVEKITRNGFLKLLDIYFQQTYLNTQINLSEINLLENMILDANLKYTAYGCRVIHLEYVFPKNAKPYLH